MVLPVTQFFHFGIFICGCRLRASNFRTEDISTHLFADREDSGRGMATVTDKEIQSRNEAKHKEVNCMEYIWWLWDTWVKERNALSWQRHFRGSSKPLKFKDAVQFRTRVVLAVEIDEPQRTTYSTYLWRSKGLCSQGRDHRMWRKRNAAQFNFQLVLHEKLIKIRGNYVLTCKGDKSLQTIKAAPSFSDSRFGVM